MFRLQKQDPATNCSLGKPLEHFDSLQTLWRHSEEECAPASSGRSQYYNRCTGDEHGTSMFQVQVSTAD
jgi:hypothetical protein